MNLLLAAALSVAASITLAAQSAPATSANASVLADGTPIHLALGRMVSSETDQAGEVVEFTVKKDLTVGNQVLLPESSSVYGIVVLSTLNDRETGKPGALEFRLESLKLSNGQVIPLRTVKQIPANATADVKPEMLSNLVNSPYAPFAHFKNGTDVTIPKDSRLTLYVSGDVAIGQAVVAKPLTQEAPADSVATRIVEKDGGSKSLGDLAREQRERGKIGGGMVSTPQ